MSKSARLRAADVRAAYALAGECRELGDDAALWRTRLSEGLSQLVDAEAVLPGELGGWGSGRFVGIGCTPWCLGGSGVNWNGWMLAVAHLRDDPGYSVVMKNYRRRFFQKPGVACRRSDMVTDKVWNRAVEYQVVYRALGANHNVWCCTPVAGATDVASGVWVTRAEERPDFTARQVSLVQSVVALVGPLVGGPLARYGEPSPADLPPRVRDVLRCLLEGDSDKQVAARLGISRYTVNQYTKHVYRHFGVQGRAELLARWVKRGWAAGLPPW